MNTGHVFKTECNNNIQSDNDVAADIKLKALLCRSASGREVLSTLSDISESTRCCEQHDMRH